MDAYTQDYGGPGAAGEFEDVTSLFEEAAADIHPEEMVFMDGFSLQDAMSAFEIGEPRLDSGLIKPDVKAASFDPLDPLLPEEVCWIIDKSFSLEMEWHNGSVLQHTVFTLLYVHYLQHIEHEYFMVSSDPSRPRELLTIILRVAVQGLLKSCDLVWRELSKGGLQDGEDWQSDKCDVSLLEAIPTHFILSKLDDAIIWISQTSKITPEWKDALRSRLLLRKSILQIIDTNVFQNFERFRSSIAEARIYLAAVEGQSIPECSPESPARRAFDPYIARKLNTILPIRVIPFRPQAETWSDIRRLLDGWDELSRMSVTDNVSTWETVGYLRAWSPDTCMHSPYIRALMQSTFFDGVLILNKFSLGWLIDRFFIETVGIPYGTLIKRINERWEKPDPPPLYKLDRALYKLITPHIRALWFNPPRRRRYFMKSVAEWHAVYSTMTEIVDGLNLKDLPNQNILAQLSSIALLWRLSCIREIVFSGLQLELYSSEEKAFVYWYAIRVIEAQLECFDNLLLVIPEDSDAFHEMKYKLQLLTAIQAICSALFIVTLPFISFDWNRIRPNFYKRYKWAFRPEYDNINALPVAHPELSSYMRACSGVLREEGKLAPGHSIELARAILVEMVDSGNLGRNAGEWSQDRLKFVKDLIVVCDKLQLPTSLEEMNTFDSTLLKWDPRIHSWFPFIKST
ncbi:Mak10 subunit, NatC N-terminal acetyltransferase-domain-containing protein [Cyathus striatus]|nr:Mak10 subunit, NatC N-terminal acetyltransferase-domain-containing protein [Cyathus striatus]